MANVRVADENNVDAAIAVGEDVIYVGSFAQDIIYVGSPSTAVEFVGLNDPNLRPNGRPVSDEEFVRLYLKPIRDQVAAFPGIEPQRVEDFASDIVLQFIAKNYLQIYDPSKQTGFAEARYREQMRKFQAGEIGFMPDRHQGKFSSFVYEFTKVRLMGIRDKANRHLAVMRSLDTYFEAEQMDEGSGMDASYLVSFGAPDQEFQNVEVRQLLCRMHEYLCSIATPTATRNFPELLVQIVKDAWHNSTGGLDREAYAQKKGITVSAVSMQLKELRMALQQAGYWHDLHGLIASREKLSVRQGGIVEV